jgi:RNA polymerase sigma-70 factor, ECF subfamily
MSSSFPTTRFPTLPLSQEKESAQPIYKDTSAARPTEEPSDGSLIAQICSGEREALALLFRRYAGLVHGIGRRILRDNAEAEDFVQDLFLYVHRKASLYDADRGSVRTWIVQTCYYKALVRRSRLASRNYYDDLNPGDRETDQLAAGNLPSYDRSGEGLFGRDGWRELRFCLSEEQWETLRLHFYEGYTFAEIAAKRKQAIGNVRHHFYRGIERLRKKLESRP